jgi:hypothetical protein
MPGSSSACIWRNDDASGDRLLIALVLFDNCIPVKGLVQANAAARGSAVNAKDPGWVLAPATGR